MITLDPDEQRRLEIETAERKILTEPEHHLWFRGEKHMVVTPKGILKTVNFALRPRKDL